jgi:hypothetical protein
MTIPIIAGQDAAAPLNGSSPLAEQSAALVLKS